MALDYDVFSPAVGFDSLLRKSVSSSDLPDLITSDVAAYSPIGSALGNPETPISLGNILSGEETGAILAFGKKNFSDTTAGWIQGMDTDGVYKWLIGNSSQSIDWSVTTAATLTVKGAVSAGTIDIGGADATSFHVDVDGNMWLGAATFAAAPFKVSNAGSLTATDLTLTGGTFNYGKTSFSDTVNAGYWIANDGFYFGSAADATYVKYDIVGATLAVKAAITTTTGSVLDGGYLSAATVASAAVNLALRGWSQTCAFSASSSTVVAWGAGSLELSDGTTYSIGASNTGTMAARTYIYFDIAVSTTAYQVTSTAATAVGNGKVLVATAVNNTGEATFQVFSGLGGLNLDGSNIVTGSVTTNEIAANTIVAGNIAAGTITTTQLAANTITAANVNVGSYINDPPDTNLVGYWAFNEASGSVAVDGSAVLNHGTISNCTYAAGIAGSALTFNATTSYISIPHNANQLMTGGFTISAWINPNSLGETSSARIVEKTDVATELNGFIFLLTGSTRRLACFVASGTTIFSSTTAVTFSTWQHVCVTVASNGTCTFYVNGVVSGTPAIGGLPSGITSTNPLYIGNQNSTAPRTFDGLIDEVRIYSSVLTAAQVQALYLRPAQNSQGFLTAVSGYFGNSTNGVTIDSTGLVLNGTGHISTATSGQRFRILKNVTGGGTHGFELFTANSNNSLVSVSDNEYLQYFTTGDTADGAFGVGAISVSSNISAGASASVINVSEAGIGNVLKLESTGSADRAGKALTDYLLNSNTGSATITTAGSNATGALHLFTPNTKIGGRIFSADASGPLPSKQWYITNQGYLQFPQYYHCSDFDEYIASDTVLASTVIAKAYWVGGGTSGTQTLIQGSGAIDQNSYVNLSTTATGSRSSTMTFGRYFNPTNQSCAEFRFRVNNITNTKMQFGFYGDATHYALFVFDTAVHANLIYFNTNNGSSSASVSTGQTISANAWKTFKMVLGPSNTYAIYIDETVLSTASTQYTGIGQCKPFIYVDNKAAAEEKIIYLDYVKIWSSRDDASAVS